MTMSHQVNEDVSQAPQRTRPEPPSGCLPGLLIVAGPIVGLMVACGGVVSSLTPPEPTVRFDQAARLQAPANLRMAISWMSPGSPNCTVQGPEGTYDVRKERRAGTSEFDAVFTTRSSGVYEIECAEVARTGEYEQYHSGAIDAYHLSYFRRMWPSERSLHTCNVRKSHGSHLVAQGADPLPGVLDADRDYRLSLTWQGGTVDFTIDGIPCVTWSDDGTVGGPARRGGAIGLRQMAPLIAEYSDLRVEAL